MHWLVSFNPCMHQFNAPWNVNTFIFQHISLFHPRHFDTGKYIHQFFARRARPKKTRTTIRHFKRYPISITAPTNCINILSMSSLLICGFSSLHTSFFFDSKELDISSHLISSLVSSLASILERSARESTKYRAINRSMYSSSQNQNLHPSYTQV